MRLQRSIHQNAPFIVNILYSGSILGSHLRIQNWTLLLHFPTVPRYDILTTVPQSWRQYISLTDWWRCHHFTCVPWGASVWVNWYRSRTQSYDTRVQTWVWLLRKGVSSFTRLITVGGRSGHLAIRVHTKWQRNSEIYLRPPIPARDQPKYDVNRKRE